MHVGPGEMGYARTVQCLGDTWMVSGTGGDRSS